MRTAITTIRRIEPAALLGAMLATLSCRAPLDNMQVMLNRHEQAVSKLPEHDRSRLMPYGPAFLTEQAVDLLPEDVLLLETAQEIAIRANPDIHAAQARLQAARGRWKEARAQYAPIVALTQSNRRTYSVPATRNRLNLQQANQGINGSVPQFSAGTPPVNNLVNAITRGLLGSATPKGDTSSFSEHSTAIVVNWLLFDGFVRDANILASKHLHDAAWSSLEDVERLLIQAVDNAYHQVQLAEEQVRIARADEAFSQEQYEETKKLLAAGRATQADTDNFRVRVLGAKADVIGAVGLRDTGRAVLAELMGIDAGMLPVDLPLSSLKEETPQEMTSPTDAPWLQRAMDLRPDLQQAQQLTETETENLRAAKGAYQPTVALTGSWGFDRGSTIRYEDDDQSSGAAIEFRWELFTGGARNARVRIAESLRAERTAQLNRLRLSIQSEIHQTIIDLKNAQAQIRLQRERLATSMENRRIIQVGYLAGKETLTRLNETQRDVIAADAGLALARIRLRQAWSDLRTAAGDYRGKSKP